MMFGSHLSIAGGLVNALNDAEKLGLDTVQIFTKNQRQWAIKPLEDAPRDAWLEKLRDLGWHDRTVAHDSYLINLASPKDDLYAKSIAMMKTELERAAALSVKYLVSHPGAHTTSTLDEGLVRIADAYQSIFNELPESDTVLCLENTAGGGSTIGRTFDELATLRQLILDRGVPAGRVGFCIDTCHALAAGYDVTSRDSADAVLDELDRTCGLKNVRVLHLNDSKGALGSRVDRHEHIGQGEVGLDGFAAFVNRPELSGVPMIMETPKGEDEAGVPFDTTNLNRLRGLIDAESASSA